MTDQPEPSRLDFPDLAAMGAYLLTHGPIPRTIPVTVSGQPIPGQPLTAQE